MGRKYQILDLLNELIDELDKPTTESEKRHGWTSQAKIGIKGYLLDIRGNVMKGGEIRIPVSIARGMDSFGVGGGDIFEKGALVSNLINETYYYKK